MNEDIVNNFETSVKKLLYYLDLDWSDSINNFYDKKNIQRKISTPSYNQVNKPIYLKSVGRWENYSKQFQEIYSTVEPWIKTFKY